MKTIKSKRDFEKVFFNGTHLSTKLIRMKVLPVSDEANYGVAFIASKRLGNAVYRNRCKRLLRESARICGLPHHHYQVLLFATRYTSQASISDLACDMERLLTKAGVSYEK